MFKGIKQRILRLRECKVKRLVFVVSSVALLLVAVFATVFVWACSGMWNVGVMSVRGNSMSPTINNNDILYICPVQYERGAVVAALCPETDNYYHTSSLVMLKRIVGLPGETVEISPNGVLIDGILIDEDYTDSAIASLQDTNNVDEIILSENEYFLLGDNRVESFDSRHIGAIHSANFLYGVTREPNDYTFSLLHRFVCYVFINIFVSLLIQFIIFLIITKTKHSNN